MKVLKKKFRKLKIKKKPVLLGEDKPKYKPKTIVKLPIKPKLGRW